MGLVNTIKDIRQLCCLGLDGQAMMPTLFHSLQKLVPSHFQIFFWANQNYEITNMFCLNLPSLAGIAKLYLSEFVNKREQEVKPTFAELIKTERGVIDWDRFMNPRFFKSDFYNAILKPLDGRHIIGSVIHEHQRVLGELVVWRAPGERYFSAKEKQLLVTIGPYMAHALSRRVNSEQTYVESGEHGLLVLDHNAEIQYASPRSRELLFWATHPQISRSTILDQLPSPPLLGELCRNLTGIFRGEDKPAPVVHHTNPWGRFCFRAHWLEHWESSKNPLIGVTIEFHKPLALALFTRMQGYPLSSRQKEVCRFLAQGHSYPRIATELNLSLYTLTDYVRRIYQKLEVHSREELLAKLGVPSVQKY